LKRNSNQTLPLKASTSAETASDARGQKNKGNKNPALRELRTGWREIKPSDIPSREPVHTSMIAGTEHAHIFQQGERTIGNETSFDVGRYGVG